MIRLLPARRPSVTTQRTTGGGRVRRSPRSPACSYDATRRALSLVATCAQCREEVLEADVIGDEEECALRDRLLAAHPGMFPSQPQARHRELPPRPGTLTRLDRRPRPCRASFSVSAAATN